jgi:transposase
MADRKFRPEIEVLSAEDVPRRRNWDDADKIRIVEESFVGHRQVSATARRHGVSRSLLTTWRRLYREGELGGEPSPAFLPLTLASVAPAPAVSAASAPPAVRPDTRVEIVLGNGRRLVVPLDVDPTALARLIAVVDGG